MHDTATAFFWAPGESAYQTLQDPRDMPEAHSHLSVPADVGSASGQTTLVYSRRECHPTASAEQPGTSSDQLELIFQALRDSWKHDTRFVSSATKINSHPAYRAIIALGPSMMPFIIEDLRKETDHWFHALRSITGHVPEVSQPASLGALRLAWLRWADENDDDLVGLREGLWPTNDG